MWPGVDAGDAAADANGLGKEDASAPCNEAGASLLTKTSTLGFQARRKRVGQHCCERSL